MLTLTEVFSLDNPSSRRVLLDDKSRILVLCHRKVLKDNVRSVYSVLQERNFTNSVVNERDCIIRNKDGFIIMFAPYDFDYNSMLGMRFSAIYIPFHLLNYETWSERFGKCMVLNRSTYTKYKPFVQFYDGE